MKSEKVYEQICHLRQKINQCQGAVWDCDNTKHLIIEPNRFNVRELGHKKAIPFCDKCGRCGVAKKPSQVQNANSYKVITRQEADQLKVNIASTKESVKSTIEQLERRYAQLRHEEKNEENERWWSAYGKYLKSPEWREKRRLVIARDVECQACLKAPAVQAHHLTYANVTEEPLYELVGVCKRCHDQITKQNRERKS